jgi:alanine racemase
MPDYSYDVLIALTGLNRLGLSVAELKEQATERHAKEKLLEGERTHLNSSNRRASIRPPTHSANSGLAASGNEVRKNDALVNVYRCRPS